MRLLWDYQERVEPTSKRCAGFLSLVLVLLYHVIVPVSCDGWDSDEYFAYAGREGNAGSTVKTGTASTVPPHQGANCITRHSQLYCPTPGAGYPRDRITIFIDENKALIRRMFGEFMVPTPAAPTVNQSTKSRLLTRRVRQTVNWFNSTSGTHQPINRMMGHLPPPGNGLMPQLQHPTNPMMQPPNEGMMPQFQPGTLQQPVNGMTPTPATQMQPPPTSPQPKPGIPPTTNKIDSCESAVEIITPFWAANSAGKVRAIVNTQHFEQAIQQEVCQKPQTNRCTGDCTCEQKYKWHRLLAYDPQNDCSGIFMDWFLFPSCCVCQCTVLLA